MNNPTFFFKPSDPLLSSEDCIKKVTKSKNIQPYLVSSTFKGLNGGTYYLICDHVPIYIGRNILDAFDILIKTHYAFNLEFAAELNLFYNFITSCIMNIGSSKPTASSLNQSWTNIWI